LLIKKKRIINNRFLIIRLLYRVNEINVIIVKCGSPPPPCYAPLNGKGEGAEGGLYTLNPLFAYVFVKKNRKF
jgi:hypothetical protein